MIKNAENGMGGPMRIGFLLSEETSKNLLTVSRRQGDEPYVIIEKCIEIMMKYLDEEEF